jgi:anti-sigma B factor antagonist
VHPDTGADRPDPGAVEVAVRSSVPGAAVVEVRGDLDAGAVDRLRAGVDEAVAGGARTVVLDLTRVVLLASAGMTLLLDLDRRLRDAGQVLLLAAGSARTVRRPLAVTGLDRVLSVHDDVEGALAAGGHGAGGAV